MTTVPGMPSAHLSRLNSQHSHHRRRDPDVFVTRAAAATPSITCPNRYNPCDPRCPIRLCDEGPAVELIQVVTKDDVDSKYGPATKQAMQVFRQLGTLNDDGLVGPLTCRRQCCRTAPQAATAMAKGQSNPGRSGHHDASTVIPGSGWTARGRRAGVAPEGLPSPHPSKNRRCTTEAIDPEHHEEWHADRGGLLSGLGGGVASAAVGLPRRRRTTAPRRRPVAAAACGQADACPQAEIFHMTTSQDGCTTDATTRTARGTLGVLFMRPPTAATFAARCAMTRRRPHRRRSATGQRQRGGDVRPDRAHTPGPSTSLSTERSTAATGVEPWPRSSRPTT